MRIIKKIILTLFVVFVLIQFYRPDRNSVQGNHSVIFITETNPPRNVKLALENNCYDCHSDNTEYPWYDNVAPISFWMANHINKGKKHLNFSSWETYDTQKKEHKLAEIIEMIETKEMPLPLYMWIHESANLTAEERDGIVAWAKKTSALYQLNRQPI